MDRPSTNIPTGASEATPLLGCPEAKPVSKQRPAARPIIIIGAGRSGTNILRDCITATQGFETWPCDEINAIWRHGNVFHPDDAFGPEQARPEVISYIRKQFEELACRTTADYVIEKTCANSLRISFVDKIFPDARFIYIVRDGRDVASSAAQRWTSSVNVLYLLKKARYVPLGDIVVYAWRFLSNRIFQWRRKDRRQAVWGPRFSGLETAVLNEPLDVVCARQWVACIEASERAFADMDPSRVYRLRYEDFASRPEEVLSEIFTWIGSPQPDKGELRKIVARVSSKAIGTWRQAGLSSEALDALFPMLWQLGYESRDQN